MYVVGPSSVRQAQRVRYGMCAGRGDEQAVCFPLSVGPGRCKGVQHEQCLPGERAHSLALLALKRVEALHRLPM